MKVETIFDSRKQNDLPEVSIIIPYYNMHLFLGEAIFSAQRQTYKNIEIVIVDDGSDQTESVQYINNIKGENLLILRTANRGVSSARNTAIERCRGNYIVPLDPDDILHPKFIEKCLPLLTADEQIGVVHCNVEMFGKVNKALHLKESKLPEMLFDNSVVVTAIYRKAHWLEFGGYKREMTQGLEDYEFWFNFLEKGFIIEKCKDVLFYYRIREKSRSTDLNASHDMTKKMMKNIYFFHQELYKANNKALFENWLELKYPTKSKRIKKIKKKIFSLKIWPRKKLQLYLESEK